MALCVEQMVDGTLRVIDPQPSNYTGCSIVVTSGAEHGHNPFVLTAEEGAQLSMAIILLWTIGAVGRFLIKTAKADSDDSERG